VNATDTLWYKDAVIYQLHVKAFFDANDDGIGDFVGLTRKLEYIKDLGATCVWLLPFYPSPLRDDGYDISDYKGIHPAYGTMQDFRAFVRAAHDRGLRVITELVINHTSDQHPWFQRARRAKPGSAYRDFYVWSDSDKKYDGTRIIFTDTETSNWAWDALAGQYYWHRFFSHQPDLNFDNPRVIRAVIDVMRFWFEAGVDGLRLDAVPYLCEREGTDNENLPETHGILKILRAVCDHEYPDRMFLAEANQWPEDVRAYFGDDDECHMAFNFPLMPRMFMAIAEEDRYPIVDIMRQTPEIPEKSQWAIFLRNHDEMTLEMVTDRERDFMYGVYANDPRARINVGIRRRLAPLMENDRRRIELMTGLLMSMPGTPIMYYGDEIGMGDNIYLSDRDGVRTPMQWSIDRNGGFSRADPARLFLPPVQDAVYGFQTVNVEAQTRSPGSLVNWMRKLISTRQGYQAFGRGSIEFLRPANRKVLSYVREFGDETILCVANLSRTAQPVALDLARFAGRVPVEMLGWSAFPTIGADRYVLTLPGHAFLWFLLSKTAIANDVPEGSAAMPELLTLVLPREESVAARGRSRTLLEREVLPTYLPKQRWFGDKDADLSGVRFVDGTRAHDLDAYLAIVDVGAADPQPYFLPLANVLVGRSALPAPLVRATLAKTRTGPREGLLVDALVRESLAIGLLDDMRAGTERPAERGVFVAFGTSALAAIEIPEQRRARRLEVEQSNTSVVVDEHVMFKAYRRLSPGIQPELEIARFLTEVGYRNTPPLLGWTEYRPETGDAVATCIAQAFIESQGDAWNGTLAYLGRFFDRARQMRGAEHAEMDADYHAVFIERARILGRRVAELHRAFATETGDPAFEPEPVTEADVAAWVAGAQATAFKALDGLERAVDRVPENLQPQVRALAARRERILARIAALAPSPASLAGLTKTRYHGDFHLGQVLVVMDDVYIVDFEGEPARPLAHRRTKNSPLRDVAGMLRSIDYASVAALRGVTADRAEDVSALEPLGREWERRSVDAFLEAYREHVAGCSSYPTDPEAARALLDLFTLEKAFYEMSYELANRPPWVRIPLEGIARILNLREDPDAS